MILKNRVRKVAVLFVLAPGGRLAVGLPFAAPDRLVDLVLEGVAGLTQVVEGPFKITVGDDDWGSVVDVEAAEEGVVQVAPGAVGCLVVERDGVFDQFHALAQALSADLELSTGVGQPGADSGAFHSDLIASLVDLGPVEQAVGGEVDEPGLALVELGELRLQGDVPLSGEVLLVGHGLVEQGVHRVGEVAGECLPGVFVAHGLFDVRCGQVRQVADPVLTASAEKVAVALAVAAGGFGVDQPAGAAGLVAAVAEQHPFQVVIQDPVADTAGGAGGKHLLNPVEQVLVDDRLVPAFDELAVDGDPAGVVGVGEHPMQLAVGHCLGVGPAA